MSKVFIDFSAPWSINVGVFTPRRLKNYLNNLPQPRTTPSKRLNAYRSTLWHRCSILENTTYGTDAVDVWRCCRIFCAAGDRYWSCKICRDVQLANISQKLWRCLKHQEIYTTDCSTLVLGKLGDSTVKFLQVYLMGESPNLPHYQSNIKGMPPNFKDMPTI